MSKKLNVTQRKLSLKTLVNLSTPAMLIIGVFLMGLIFWIVQSNDNIKEQVIQPEHLANQSNALCTPQESKLTCYSFKSGETVTFIIPKEFQQSSLILPSPDGTRMLVQTKKGDVVVVDNNFSNKHLVFTAKQVKSRVISYYWGAGSKNILLSEVRRDKNDAKSLPAPLNISLFDLDSEKNSQVYKTGENVDVEAIDVIGANDTYVFIAQPLAKNWVAQMTENPPKVILAIRIYDGFVQEVNAAQMNNLSEQELFAHNSITFDGSRNLFVITGQTHDNENYVMLGILEVKDFGLSIKRVNQLYSSEVFYEPIFTSRGVLANSKTDDTISFATLVTSSTVDLQPEKHGSLISLKNMPNLPTDHQSN